MEIARALMTMRAEGYDPRRRIYKASAISPITCQRIYTEVTTQEQESLRDQGLLRFNGLATYLCQANKLMNLARKVKPMDRDLSALDHEESRVFQVRVSNGTRYLAGAHYQDARYSRCKLV